MDQTIRYFLIAPSSARRSFTLVAYTPEGRKKKYQPLSDSLKSQSEKINEQYLSGVITQAEARTLFNELMQAEYKKAGVRDMVLKNSTLSKINQKIFNQFWDKVYSVRFLADEKSPRYDILKAIRLIEPLSLATATEGQLQAALKKSCKNVAEHRRAIDRLNQLLKFLGRDFVLRKPPEGLRQVQYITRPELDRVVALVDDPVEKDMIVTLFGTGLRLSEALALSPEDLSGEILNVHQQLVPGGEYKLPKRNKTGKTLVLDFALEATRRWCAVEDKEQYRFRIFNSLMAACQRAFPTAKAKWISPHDLRHSHAIYMLGRGASLTQVALNLRNRVDVCQKYYTGFAHTDDTLEGLKKILKER